MATKDRRWRSERLFCHSKALVRRTCSTLSATQRQFIAIYNSHASFEVLRTRIEVTDYDRLSAPPHLLLPCEKLRPELYNVSALM